MWWLRLNCIILASFAILSVTKAEGTRHKKDLSYVKNFIKSAVFGSDNKTPILTNTHGNYKIFRIPGFNNVLVKAVPKVAGTGTVSDQEKNDIVSQEDANVSIVGSYLGTKTQAETLNALQGVQALFESGVLTATKSSAEVVRGEAGIGPLPPHLKLISVGEGTFEKPHILLDTSTLCDDVQADEIPVVVQQSSILQGRPFLSIFHRPIPFPSIFKPITPIEVPVPALPTKYSYKQIHKDGKVTTYSSNDDHNVIVSESYQPGPLPPYVTYRIQEAMKMGAHGVQGMATIPIFEGNIQRPKVQYFTSPKVNPYRPAVSGSNFSYKQVHNDGTVTSYESDRTGANVVVTEAGIVPPIPVFITDRIEKVAATAITGKQPNPLVLSGPNVVQTYWYRPFIYGQQMDTKGEVRVKIDNKEQQKPQQNSNVNIGSQEAFSYQTIHKDGTVTNQYHGSGDAASAKPEVKPISPAFIEDRLQTISKTSGGSFSYKILHSDGSVTNYGVFGVHKGINGESKIVPFEKTKPNPQEGNFMYFNNIQASQPPIKDDLRDHSIQQNNYPILQNVNSSPGSYSYKAVHSDGSTTIYSQDGIKEINEDNKFMVDKEKNQQSVNIITANEQGITHNIQMNAKENELKQNVKTSSENNAGSIPGSFSYKTVHGDGSVTIYSQNGVKEERNKLFKNENQEIFVSADVKQQEINQNLQTSTQNIVDLGPNSFSYKAVHSDGSKTIYSQNGVTEESKNELMNNENVEVPTSSITIGDNNEFQNSQHKQTNSESGSYSYKTIHADGSATTYSQNEVKEIDVPSLDVGNKNLTTVAQQTLNDVKINMNEQQIHTNLLNKGISSAASFSYKPVHSDRSEIDSEKGSEEMKSLNVNTNNVAPSPQFSYKKIHSDGSVNNMQSVSLQKNDQNQGQLSADFDGSKYHDDQMNSLIIPPGPELPELNDLSVTPVSVLVADSNNVLFTKPVVSSYSYKQINHHSPDQFMVAVNIDDAALKDTELRVASQVAANDNKIDGGSIDTIPKDYVYIPPSTTIIPPPIKPLVSTETKKATQNPPSAVVLAPVDVVPCEEKLSEHPIVVLDEPMQYSYEHRKVDGSAMHVESDQSVVSVSISSKKRHDRNRGDIPESP